MRLDADGVQAVGAVGRQGGHVGVAVGVRVQPVYRAPGQRALPPVRVLVPAQRLRAEELPLAVVAREHTRRFAGGRSGCAAPPLLSVVLDSVVPATAVAATTVSDRSTVTSGQEEELDASWLLMSNS